MLNRHLVPLAALVLMLLLTGCKKTAAFVIVDANTQQPVPGALIDHRVLYGYTDARSGQRYLKSTDPTDEQGWHEVHKPQSTDSYVVRSPGYQSREVRMTEPGEMAEYMVVGGANITEWIEVEPRDNDEDDIPTFVIPLNPN